MVTPESFAQQEIDHMIARLEVRIEQERIHVAELSADSSRQKAAKTHLAEAVAGLTKLQAYRRQID